MKKTVAAVLASLLLIPALALPAGTSRVGVTPKTCATGEAITAIAADGTFTCTAVSGGASAPADWGGYDPDAVPDSLVTGSSDEFEGSISANWRWGNQGTATDTYDHGTALMWTPAEARNHHVRWVDAPNAVDFTVTMKATMLGKFDGSSNVSQFPNWNEFGIAVLVTGTEATPTLMHWALFYVSDITINPGHYYTTSYTAGPSTQFLFSNWNYYSFIMGTRSWVWIQFRYTASTKLLQMAVSHNGVDFWLLGTGATLASHPIAVGRMTDSNSGAAHAFYTRVAYFRVRTDADRNLSGK